MLPDGPARGTDTTLRWLSRPYDLLRECAETFGDRFTIDLGAHGMFVVVSSPAAIRDVFTGDPDVLHASEGNRVMRPFLGPASLLLLEGHAHLRERRLLAPAFHGRRVAKCRTLIEAAALSEIDGWVEGDEIVAQSAMQRVSIDVILGAIFGVSGGRTRDALRDALLAFLDDPKFNLGLMGTLDTGSESPAWTRFRGSLSRIRELIQSLVARRRTEPEADAGDALAMLLSATREDGTALGDDELEDELLTLCVTGYETTATALAWGLHWIHATPGLCERLRKRLLGLSLEEISRDAELDAVCSEILRIHPVIPVVARRVLRDVAIDGQVVPSGCIVAPCIYLAHHRPETYPAPESFRPERFVERRYGPYEYLPFGGGVRRCVGMQLALAEMRIVLGAVLENARLEPIDPSAVRPRRRSVTIAPDTGPRFRVLGNTRGEAHARTG